MPQLHHLLTVPAAALVAVALAADTVVLVTTGHRTVVTDDAAGTPVASALLGVAVAVVFALLSWTVHCERARFAQGNRAVRLARRPLTVGLAALAVGIGVAHPLELLLGVTEDSPWRTVSGLVAFAVLIMTQVSAMVVGIATLRHNPLGIGARLLACIVPGIALTGLLAAVDPHLAEPVYVTMITVLGVALLGVGVRTPRLADAPASAAVGA